MAFKSSLDVCTSMARLFYYFDLPKLRFRIKEKIYSKAVIDVSKGESFGSCSI